MSISPSLQARIDRCVTQYSFNPRQKRDDIGRWVGEFGATKNLNEFNKLLEGTGAESNPAWLVKDDEEIVHQTPEGKFGVRTDKQKFRIENHVSSELGEDDYVQLESHVQNLKDVNEILRKYGLPEESLDHNWESDLDAEDLRKESQEVEQANQILAQYPSVEPAKLIAFDDGTGMERYVSSADPEQVKEAHDEIKKVNRLLAEFPYLTPATMTDDEGHFSSISSEDLSDAIKEWKRANKVLALNGIPQVKLVEDDGNYYPDVDESIYDMHDQITKLNKRLVAHGMEPNLKMTLESNGEPEASHDLDEVESALDVLKAFKPKKKRTDGRASRGRTRAVFPPI